MFNISVHGVNFVRAKFDRAAMSRWATLTFVSTGHKEELTVFFANEEYARKFVEAINGTTLKVVKESVDA